MKQIRPLWTPTRRARMISLCSLWLVASFSASADPLVLVSKAEFALERASAENRLADAPVAKAIPAPDVPKIEVEAPKLGKQLRTPLAIRLVFQPAADAKIVPESFRVLYGYLGLDITDRVLRSVKPTIGGLVVEQAIVPAGEHRLRLQVSDDKGRRGETVLSFTVLEE